MSSLLPGVSAGGGIHGERKKLIRAPFRCWFLAEQNRTPCFSQTTTDLKWNIILGE